MSSARPPFTRALITVVIPVCSLLMPTVVSAQQEQTPGALLQEVIVTATKREANLQNVPFSVSATSQSQIINSGAQDLVDLSRNIASFTVADLGTGVSDRKSTRLNSSHM